MSAERRLAMIQQMERSGLKVATREYRGLLIVEVQDHRGQVAASAHTQRFDIEGAYRQWQVWQQLGRPRATTKIARIDRDTRESA